MGITLTSKTIKSTYQGLLKLSDNNPLTTVYKAATDGFGNESGLSISSIGISGKKIYSEMSAADIQTDLNGSVVITRDYLGTFSYELLSNKGVADGYVPLDSNALIPAAYLPHQAISETFVVASQAAMLAIPNAHTGDVAIRTDIQETFILKGSDSTVLTDWTKLLSPTDSITSVNGLTGAVQLDLDFTPSTGILTLTGGGSVDLGLLSGTDLTISMHGASSLQVDSSTGSNITLPAATNTKAGLLESSKLEEIGLNTAKVGITPAQAAEITVNTAKVGITGAQAQDIIDNSSEIVIINNEQDVQDAAIALNTAKTSFTGFTTLLNDYGFSDTFTHDQGMPSASWTVQHNLGKYPSISVADSAKNIVVGEVTYVDLNNLVIVFNSAFSGKAHMN